MKEEDFLGEVTFQLRLTQLDGGTTGQCTRPDFGDVERQETYRESDQAGAQRRGVEREDEAAPAQRSDHGRQSPPRKGA